MSLVSALASTGSISVDQICVRPIVDSLAHNKVSLGEGRIHPIIDCSRGFGVFPLDDENEAATRV